MGNYRANAAQRSDSSFYSFLAYYKILELHLKRESIIMEWINSSLEHVHEIRRQIEEISSAKPTLNVGRRIIDIRNGIAHALGNKRPIDMDGYTYIRELHLLLFLLKELAERMMTEELGFAEN
jgi:hypothetical protein